MQLSGDATVFLEKWRPPPGNASPDRQDRIAPLMEIIATTREWGLPAKELGEEQSSQNI